jgi:hypothetical protein
MLDGKQPRSLSARKLSGLGALRVNWSELRLAWGFAPA